MVDVVAFAHAVAEREVIGHGSDHVVYGKVLDDERVLRLLDVFEQLFALEVVHHVHERRIIDFLVYAQRLWIAVDKGVEVDRVVADDLELRAVFCHDEDFVHALVLQRQSRLFVQNFTLDREHFAVLADDVAGEGVSGYAQSEAELFVELISAHARQIVSAGVVEGVADELGYRFVVGDFARTHLLIKLYLCLVFVMRNVLFDGLDEYLLLAEHVVYLLVRAQTERTQQRRGGNFAVAVHVDPQDVVLILLEFQPSAARRHDRGVIARHARLIYIDVAIDAGAAHELADDDSLRAVDDKGTVFGHHGEIAHEHVFFRDLARIVAHEPHLHLERTGVSCVPVLALFDRIGGFVLKIEADIVQLYFAGKVTDGGVVVQDLLDAFGDEPLIRILLEFDQIRYG